jgi:hypothetical protein
MAKPSAFKKKTRRGKKVTTKATLILASLPRMAKASAFFIL